jgi:hypothetical protein
VPAPELAKGLVVHFEAAPCSVGILACLFVDDDGDVRGGDVAWSISKVAYPSVKDLHAAQRKGCSLWLAAGGEQVAIDVVEEVEWVVGS